MICPNSLSIFFIFNHTFKLYHHSGCRQHDRLPRPGLDRHAERLPTCAPVKSTADACFGSRFSLFDDQIIFHLLFLHHRNPTGFAQRILIFLLLLRAIYLVERSSIGVFPFRPTICAATQDEIGGSAWRAKGPILVKAIDALLIFRNDSGIEQFSPYCRFLFQFCTSKHQTLSIRFRE